MSENIINKTMARADLDTPEARRVAEELNDLVRLLRARGLAASTWYGTLEMPPDVQAVERANRGPGYRPLPNAADDARFPWFLYWEIAWVTLHAGFRSGQTVLDLGGSSSLFSYYLASKGLCVTTVDVQASLVENANRVAKAMGWALENHVMDMRTLSFDRQFDHVTSICVLEHLKPQDRKAAVARVRDVLRPGGRFSITFDYRNPARTMRIASPQDVEEQFVAPSGLRVRGNRVFADDGANYLLPPFRAGRVFRFWKLKLFSVLQGDFPIWEVFRSQRVPEYTFGALFLEKAGSDYGGESGGEHATGTESETPILEGTKPA